MNEITETAALPFAIEAEGLTKLFGALHALKGIDLEVGIGERFAIFGPNGAGKTTLIRIISTLVRPSSGTVRINGVDIQSKPVLVRSQLGVAGHHTFLYDNLTVHDNLKFYGRMYDVADLEQRIREVIARVELESRLYDRVSTLSRGMQQRVSLARAIIHNPPIMFLDEPEVGLDRHAISIMKDILQDNKNEGKTIFLATHNLERGLELCDRFAILNRGSIVYQASKQDIKTSDFKSIYDHYTGMDK